MIDLKSDDSMKESHEMSSMKENHGVSKDAHGLVKKELKEVRIDEKLGTALNTRIPFRDQKGREVELSDFIGDKPIVLSFVYYSCPLFCNYVLQAKKEVLKKMDLNLGDDYLALSISFDPKDHLESSQKTHENYTSDFGDQKDQWSFLYGDLGAIMKITSQIGFYFKWIEANKEYAHTAAIYVISPDGRITRYFYGIQYDPFDLKLALLEAKKEQSRSTIDRILLYCYRYSSEERGYVLQARRIMRAGGMVTVVVVFGFLSILFWREKNHKRSDS